MVGIHFLSCNGNSKKGKKEIFQNREAVREEKVCCYIVFIYHFLSSSGTGLWPHLALSYLIPIPPTPVALNPGYTSELQVEL